MNTSPFATNEDKLRNIAESLEEIKAALAEMELQYEDKEEEE